MWPEFSNHMFNMSLRPAKPTRKQGRAAGQERHIAGGTFSAQVLQIWGPLFWASDDRALMSLNLAPKAVTAFRKKSQFYVLALILSLHPKLEQGQGPCCGLTGGRHLLPSSPALKSSAASSPSSWEGSVSPSRRLLPILPMASSLKPWRFLTSLESRFVCLCPVSPLFSHDVCPTHSQKHMCMKPENMKQGSGNFSIL